MTLYKGHVTEVTNSGGGGDCGPITCLVTVMIFGPIITLLFCALGGAIESIIRGVLHYSR